MFSLFFSSKDSIPGSSLVSRMREQKIVMSKLYITELEKKYKSSKLDAIKNGKLYFVFILNTDYCDPDNDLETLKTMCKNDGLNLIVYKNCINDVFIICCDPAYKSRPNVYISGVEISLPKKYFKSLRA